MSGRRLLLAGASICIIFVALAGTASAAAIFRYAAYFDPSGADASVAGGSVSVLRLDSTKSTRLVVLSPTGPTMADVTAPAGGTSISSPQIAGLQPGSTVQVRQPIASVSPTESYVIPSPSISLAAGGTSISGTVPAGLTGTLIGDFRCDVNEQPVPLGAGAFSVPRVKIVPGQLAQLAVSSSQGDVTSILAASPGETPCITISAVADVLPPPGAPAPAGSYNINIDHLLSNHGQSVRVVARRGSTAYFDQSADSPYLSTNSTTKPLPGDVVDVYRPKTAPTPSYSQTIPQVSAKFDAAVDLIAVDTPAGGVLRAYACRTYTCGNENARGLRDFVAGRKVLNFGASEGSNVAIDLHPTDIVNVYFTNADFSMSYAYQALPGDLVAPTASFKLPSKLKISSLVKSLKKGYKLKLSSTEAGTASLKLGKLASISKPVKVGSNTFYLKFSKSGKKQIKKLAKKGKKAKPLTVSLTSVVTDASGNAATVTKSTKIKP